MVDPERNPILPNLRASVYCTAIKHGGVDEWEFAWRIYRLMATGQMQGAAGERYNLLAAMSCTREPWLINR